STAVMLEAITRAGGMRVGLWTSPHLHSYRERIQVDRVLISQADLARLTATLPEPIAAVTAATGGAPVTFAIGFALALCYFAEQQVDLAVLEVGLGGMYDSAAVIEPLLSVITAISYDHMEILGPTLAAIAEQKAGIMWPGRPTITAPQEPEALAALVAHAGAVGTPLYQIIDPQTDRPPAAEEISAGLQRIDPQQAYHGSLRCGLEGTFQRENSLLAIGAVQLLRAGGMPLDDQAIAHGLAMAHWPGRFEIVPGTPIVVIDGAHNGDSLRRLAGALRDAFPGRRIMLVFGTSRDKDLVRMLPQIVPLAAAIVLTASRHPRALADLAHLEALVRDQLAGKPLLLTSIPDPAAALAYAHTLAQPDDVICVTGSLFVAAAAREALGLAVPD
ncbi:MAG TPA: cyanophycin synthetase, partial [Roseiflexaceae bacterium]|nr:cyanophycin synthetase [Roseiflexaceae bacterium]